MPTTIRRIVAIFLGLIAAMAVVALTDGIVGKVFPPPAGTNFNDAEAVKAVMLAMPIKAFLLLLVGYAIASFVGGVVATLLSGRQMVRPSVVVGIVLTAGGLMNALALPHPIWFVAINALIYLPAAWLGYKVSGEPKLLV
jgi:hypothetical protein